MKRYNTEYNEARKMTKDRPRICVNCGSAEDIEMHHVVPLSEGGNNVDSNIVMLCRECHYKAHGARIGRYRGERTGRPRVSKPDGAEEFIEKYLRGEISGVEALKIMGMPRQHNFKTIWFVEEYLKSRGIEEIHTNRGSRDNHATEIWYKDGRIEKYRNGVKVLPGGETTE